MPEAVRRQNNKRPMKKSFSLAAIFMAMAFVANVQTAYADTQRACLCIACRESFGCG